MRIRFPRQPNSAPRCGGSHSRKRSCLRPLLLSAYSVDGRGEALGDPTWWCPTHHDRPDPAGAVPPTVGVTAGGGWTNRCQTPPREMGTLD